MPCQEIEDLANLGFTALSMGKRVTAKFYLAGAAVRLGMSADAARTLSADDLATFVWGQQNPEEVR